jgi:FkbM family methyltransferase
MLHPGEARLAPPPPRSPIHAAYRRFSRLAPVAGAAERPAAVRLRRALRQSGLVRERARYAVAAALGVRGVHPYQLRDSGLPVWLRHPGDSWTFEEIFGAKAYDPPAAILERLEGRHDIAVADLGANVGLFATFILDTLPRSRVVCYEPDPGNAAVCRRTLAWAEHAGRCRLVQAAAGVAPGVVRFEAGLGGRSHVALAPGSNTIAVRIEDVMSLLAASDLAKIDIEGGEWSLLSDERLREAGPDTLVLEFHPEGCPTADSERAASDLLTAAGYCIVPPPRPFYGYEFPPGQGVLWAMRARSQH